MFARTARLLLRPAWPEDAPALAEAIAAEGIARDLASVPWPYSLCHAEVFRSQPCHRLMPSLLLFERTAGAPVLVGACGLEPRASGVVEIGFWIGRPFRGRGLAGEACSALIDIARMLGLPEIRGADWTGNAASGRVIEKLGFTPLGVSAPRACCTGDGEVQARLMRLRLTRDREALAA